MADKTLRFVRVRNPDATDWLELFPSESDLELFPSQPAAAVSLAVSVSSSSPASLADGSRGKQGPTLMPSRVPASDKRAASLAARMKWWLAGLIFLPPLTTAAFLRLPYSEEKQITNAPPVSTAVIETTLAPRRPEVKLDATLPPAPALLEELETVATEPVARTTTMVGLRRVQPSASVSSQANPALSRTSSDSLAGETRVGESAPAMAPSPAFPVERLKFQGSIDVESQPAGAQVFVDGQQIGVTPLHKSNLPAGSHVVRVELDGFTRWSAAVQVTTAKTLRLVVNLQPASH